MLVRQGKFDDTQAHTDALRVSKHEDDSAHWRGIGQNESGVGRDSFCHTKGHNLKGQIEKDTKGTSDARTC